MRVYDAVVAALETIGVDAAYGGAGENAAGLMLALDASNKIRPVIAKNEQGAAFMACGHAMFTGKLGVCFATAGPGAFNLISGMCVALTDSYPLLAISGYSTVAWQGRGGLNETSGLARTPDSRMMFRAATKKDPETGEPADFLVTDPDDLIDTLQKAINIAFEGRPGPVHIAVAEDITDPKVEVTNFRPLSEPQTGVAPDPDALDRVSKALEQAIKAEKTVVMLAGFGAILAGANDIAKSFIERFQIPLLTTMDGKGIVAEENPLAIGLYCDSGHKAAWDLFSDADVVLAVGNSFAQHATFDFFDGLFDEKTLIHVNIDAGEFDKFYKADHVILGDARQALQGLFERLDAVIGPVPKRDYRPKDYDERFIISPQKQLHPGEMVQKISQLLPPGGIVLADAGAHAAWAGYYLELKEGQNFRKPGTYGPMGIGVCGAIGAKYAEMHRPVVATVGDGSYLMSGFELMTAVQYDIPVVWVIFNDREFKLIKLYQLSAFFKTGLTEFENPDYAAYARACGADGYVVNQLDEFEKAFGAALASGRPSLIDARITRLALPNYSPHPEGVLAAIRNGIRTRFGL
ncbi:thiamine pyrophosphate-binding protein [Ruegeria lacuscaerulensis]|uniref:thiamine pyrophosphate-binding protein n=1 Tax=Ruegeria lacuscaerulensis TaxID=55218 RepID=UPI00147CDAA3|nr:thiamine pyrophosphate-binding protein [Ruegeria lacuscaerulensis]